MRETCIASIKIEYCVIYAAKISTNKMRDEIMTKKKYFLEYLICYVLTLAIVTNTFPEICITQSKIRRTWLIDNNRYLGYDKSYYIHTNKK